MVSVETVGYSSWLLQARLQMTPNAFSSHQKPAIAITDTTKLDIGPYLFAVVSLVHIFYQGCSVGHNNGVLSLQSIFYQPTGRLGGLLLTDRLLPKGPSRISLDRELWHTCDKNLVLKDTQNPHFFQPSSPALQLPTAS